MTKETYYIRVSIQDLAAFKEYIKANKLEGDPMFPMVDSINSQLFLMVLTSEEELAIRLTFKLEGCMNFNRSGNKLVTN